MGLETGTYIGDLVETNPVGATDFKQDGDNHLRLIKSTIKNTFPGLVGAFARVQTKSTGYTVVVNDNTTLIRCSATLTLSLAAAASLGNKFWFAVLADGVVAVTIDPNASELINGATTLVIPKDHFALVWCDGTGFYAWVSHRNLGLTNNQAVDELVIKTDAASPLSKVIVTAAYISIDGVVVENFNKTADITVSGAGGLDTGAEAASTWYYIHAIAKDDGTEHVLLSLSPTAPTLPSGYTRFRAVGLVRNNASSNFLRFFQKGKKVHYLEDTQVSPLRILTAGQATTFTNVDASAVIPLSAVRAELHVAVSISHSVVGAAFWAVIGDNQHDTTVKNVAVATVQVSGVTTGGDVVMDTPYTATGVRYKINAVPNVVGGVYIDVLGFEL